MTSKEGSNMEKIHMSAETISYPMPCSLVGVNVGGKPNYLTVAWFSLVNFKPPYRPVEIDDDHGDEGTGT